MCQISAEILIFTYDKPNLDDFLPLPPSKSGINRDSSLRLGFKPFFEQHCRKFRENMALYLDILRRESRGRTEVLLRDSLYPHAP